MLLLFSAGRAAAEVSTARAFAIPAAAAITALVLVGAIVGITS